MWDDWEVQVGWEVPRLEVCSGGHGQGFICIWSIMSIIVCDGCIL